MCSLIWRILEAREPGDSASMGSAQSQNTTDGASAGKEVDLENSALGHTAMLPVTLAQCNSLDITVLEFSLSTFPPPR